MAVGSVVFGPSKGERTTPSILARAATELVVPKSIPQDIAFMVLTLYLMPKEKSIVFLRIFE